MPLEWVQKKSGSEWALGLFVDWNMDVLLDDLLTVTHITLILFNVLGWIPTRTARLNLITLALTGLA